MTDLSSLIKFVNVEVYQLTEETHVAWQQIVSFLSIVKYSGVFGLLQNLHSLHLKGWI